MARAERAVFVRIILSSVPVLLCKDKYVSTSMIDWRPRAKAILNEQ